MFPFLSVISFVSNFAGVPVNSKGNYLLSGTKGLFLALIQHYFVQRNIKETNELGTLLSHVFMQPYDELS